MHHYMLAQQSYHVLARQSLQDTLVILGYTGTKTEVYVPV